MRSELQNQASRDNGSKSRGPVTEEGKRASSQNAVKHGILSTYVVINSENEQGFIDLTTRLYDELQPQPGVEQDLVNTMAVARWRTTRLWIIEKCAMETQMTRENDQARAAQHKPGVLAGMAFRSLADNSRTLDLVNRYESRYDRQYFRAHRRLLETQDRRMRNEPDNTPPPAPAPGAPITPSVSAGNSSDFAKGTQAEPENVENKEPDTEPTAATIPAPPVARRSFYLTTVPAAIFDPVPPENPAVFHAGTAASHP